MVFDDTIKFKGTYRTYQQRVLNNITKFLDNEKIHIVAAPGSGKTTLGLELILRINQPSLVLVPSIAIREQWIERFANGFLADPSLKNMWISNDIKIQKPIICITYQAFYCAYKKEINSESIDDFNEEENNYGSFNLLDTINSYNIKTICLDECHHLKSEWWKSLEMVIKKIVGCKLIALTATPPYDSSAVEWQKYIDLCGPIDDEIFVPELIKDKCLCPHQDYVFYSYPTKEEQIAILKSYGNGLKIFSKYKNNKKLVEIVSKNLIYTDYKKFKKAYYENEPYYQSLVLFLIANKVKVPFLIRIFALKDKFLINNMEILLQHVLFEDQNSYPKSEFLVSLKKELSALSLVHNRKVCIVHDERINKKMFLSLSKLDSIKQIVTHEYNCIKDEMKCLILTDYIKIKTKTYIGNDKPIDSFGSLPIFEYLRRANLDNIKLCLLSGTICIIPSSCINYLSDEFTFEKTFDENYFEVIINDSNRKKLVSSITKLFEDGMFNVLIGTKSLLGEGWDSPCINTLIMASFVGSYVLSNQMRGRAIRTNKNDLEKKSNVWHLVCLNPFDYHYSYDYYNLEKRCSTFVGINVKNNSVENGIDRLANDGIPKNESMAKIENMKSLLNSSNRNQVKEVWEKCIDNCYKIDSLVKMTIVPTRRVKREYSFYSAFINTILCFVFFVSAVGFYTSLLDKNVPKVLALILSLTLITLLLLTFIRNLIIVINLFTPKSKLKTIGKAILKALIKKQLITNKNIKVKVKINNLRNLSIYLSDATTYEQNLFFDCVIEMLSEINQPRYLLTKPRKLYYKEFYVVPDVFKKNKDSVKFLKKEIDKKMGTFGCVFAKNESGKNIVLKAQFNHYLKFKKIDIRTKNVLMKKNKKK